MRPYDGPSFPHQDNLFSYSESGLCLFEQLATPRMLCFGLESLQKRAVFWASKYPQV